MSDLWEEQHMNDSLRREIERLQALKTPATSQLLNITKAALDNAEAEIKSLKAELQIAQFQPNQRALTRNIIRALVLEIRTLRLELKQRDQQAGR